MLHSKYNKVNGKRNYTRLGNLWYAMNSRCNSKGTQSRSPTYIGCSMSDEFKCFESFSDWVVAQIGWDSKDQNGEYYQIDKDILINGNKLYSSATCVFVPRAVNSFLTLRGNDRGDLPLGVTYHKQHSRYMPQCRDGEGKRIFLGYYDTPEEAYEVYKIQKELVARQIAIRLKGLVDERVIFVLENFKLEDAA